MGAINRGRRGALWAAVLCLTMVLAVSPGVPAQDFEDEPVTITGAASADRLAPGDSLQLVFTLKIDGDFYLYQDKVTLALKDTPGFTAGDPILPEAERKYDNVMEQVVPIYRGEVKLRLPVVAGADVPDGPVTLIGVVGYQSCTSSYCLMPTTVDVPVAITIDPAAQTVLETAEGGTATEAGSDPGPADNAQGLKGALDQDNLFLALLFCFLGGIAASLTPCVYPMIPITISVIGARSAGGKLKGFILSLFYVLGIAITYSVAGMAAAKTGAVFGTILQNPWVVGGIAVVFVLMALAMFGAFELQVPTSVSTKLGGYQGRGVFGVLVMGAITGLVASPCVGPVLVVLLTYVAQTQSVLLGFLLLFTFAVGLGLLFIVIGTFSGILVNLPRSGAWMVAVRNIFGVLMILVAFYYIAPLTPDWLFAPLLGIFLLVTGLVAGWPGSAVEPPMGTGQVWAVGFRRAIGVIGVVLGIYLIVGALLIHGFVLPPMSLAGAAASGGGPAADPDAGVDWLHDEVEALARAAEDGKPLIIDFTADWCAACKELSAFTFSAPEVQAELERFVSAKIDFTAKTDEVERLSAKYLIRGLPLIVFYDSRGNLVESQRVIGFIDKDKMLAILKGVE
jgi:thiol:disulfide interchange protein DsbD